MRIETAPSLECAIAAEVPDAAHAAISQRPGFHLNMAAAWPQTGTKA
jgi:hypothetical protein